MHTHLHSVARRGSLSETQLFAGLGDAALRDVDGRTTMRRVVPGTVVEPEPGTIYVVKAGRLVLYCHEITIGTLERSAVFGDSPLIGETCSGLLVRVVEDTLLCMLTADDLRQLIHRHPQLGLNLLELVGRRAGGRVA